VPPAGGAQHHRVLVQPHQLVAALGLLRGPVRGRIILPAKVGIIALTADRSLCGPHYQHDALPAVLMKLFGHDEHPVYPLPYLLALNVPPGLERPRPHHSLQMWPGGAVLRCAADLRPVEPERLQRGHAGDRAAARADLAPHHETFSTTTRPPHSSTKG
jgi:hypothetical protein